eukprot:s1_g897.t1
MSAKRLVLSLFGALDDEALPIPKLILGGNVFGIEESAVRVATNRLVSDGVLSLQERGWYGIGEGGEPLYEASRAWQRQDNRLVDWDGGWFCVHVSHLGRSDRKALRARNRALMLGGFAEFKEGLWVRPNNISLATDTLADELRRLGLDADAIVLRAEDLIHPQSESIGSLWDRRELEASYSAALKAMEASEAALASKSQAAAAREVLEIGSAVVSVLTHDPLLPNGFVDTALRRSVYDAMLRYDALGKSIWETLFAQAGEAAPTSA